MAKQYKDLSRKQIGNVPTIDTSLIKPQNPKPNVDALEALKGTIGVLNDFYVEGATREAKKIGLEDGANSITVDSNNVPQISAPESGGTIYQEAFLKSQVVAYQNSITTSVQGRVNKSLQEFSKLGNASDIGSLQTILKTNLDPILETIDPSQKQYTRSVIQNQSSAVLKSFISQDITRQDGIAKQNVADGIKNFKQSIEKNNVQFGSPEFEKIKNSIASLLDTGVRLNDKTYSKGYIDNLSKEINSLAKVNSFQNLLLGVNEEGKNNANVKELGLVQGIINGENKSVTINNVVINKKYINDLNLLDAEKRSLATKIATISTDRVNDVKYNIQEITTLVQKKYKDAPLELNEFINSNNDKGAKEYIDNLNVNNILDNSNIENNYLNKKAANEVSQSIKDKLRNTLNQNLILKANALKKNKIDAIGKSVKIELRTANADEALKKIEQITSVSNDTFFLSLKDTITNNPAQWNTMNTFMQELEGKIELNNNPKELKTLINLIEGNGSSNDENYFGYNIQEITNKLGTLTDYALDRLKALDAEMKTGGTLSESDMLYDKVIVKNNPNQNSFTSKQINGVLNDNVDKFQALNIRIEDIPYDPKNENHPVNTTLRVLKRNNGNAQLTSGNKLLNIAKQGINNGNYKAINNIGIPLFTGANQLGFDSIAEQKNLIAKFKAVEKYSEADLKKFTDIAQNLNKDNKNVWDNTAINVMVAIKQGTTKQFTQNPSEENAINIFKSNVDVNTLVFKAMKKSGIDPVKGNALIEGHKIDLYYKIASNIILGNEINYKDIIKETSGEFFELNSLATVDPEAPNADQDLFQTFNKVITPQENELVSVGQDFFDSKDVDLKPNAIVNLVPLMLDLKKNIANGNINIDNIIEDNLIKSDNVISRFKKRTEKLGYKYRRNQKKKAKFDVKEIKGIPKYTMNGDINLIDLFSIKGQDVIPGRNLFFSKQSYIDADNKPKLGYIAKIIIDNVQHIVTDTEGKEYVFDAPVDDSAFVSILNKSNAVDDAIAKKNKTVSPSSISGLDEMGGSETIKPKEKKSTEDKLPSIKNKALLNDEEYKIYNTKRQILVSGIVEDSSLNATVKKNMVIELSDNEYVIAPSQKIDINDNGEPVIKDLTEEEAIANTDENTTVYKSKINAENVNDKMHKLIKEDINDIMEDEVSEPIMSILSPRGEGQAVVNTVVDVLNTALPMDEWTQKIMKGMASTESQNGTDDRTYTNASTGIWQLDKGTPDVSLYADIKARYKKDKDAGKNSLLVRNVDKLTASLNKQGYDFNLPTMTYEELKKPINNGAVARLWLTNYSTDKYNTLEKAAAFWKKNYNTKKGDGKVKHFLDKAKAHY